jgi:hypothetical protein
MQSRHQGTRNACSWRDFTRKSCSNPRP